MQFREQGKKMQCIRSTYDPASKRSRQHVVFAFDRWSDKLPSDLTGLTDIERQELAVWFDARKATDTQNIKKYRAAVADRTLSELADAVQFGGIVHDAHAAAVWRGLADVAKALRKAGHPKPKL